MTFSHINSRGEQYFLNRRVVTLANGTASVAYFFTKEERPITAWEELPKNMVIVESPRSGILFLKKQSN